MSETLETLVRQIVTSEMDSSLVKKYLTAALVEKVKYEKTKYGGTLADCIRSGAVNADSAVGVYATDPDAYTVFSDLFYPIIRDAHHLSTDITAFTQPAVNFGPQGGDPTLGNLDPDGAHVLSTRVRIGRNLDGFGFHPVLTNESRLRVEARMVEALKELPGDLAGTYRPLTDMSAQTQQRLLHQHLLFPDTDRFLEPTGMFRDWPNGRGLFSARGCGLHVWVNEEDHIRVFCLEQGGHLDRVCAVVAKAVLELEKHVTFSRHPRLGYLTMCPSNVGTTVRASALMRLPRLSALPLFKDICFQLRLDVRGTQGEHTESEDGTYDVSNKRRLGLTEIEAVREMARGVRVLLLFEKSIESCLSQ